MVIVLKRGKLRGEENRFPCLNSIETFPPLEECWEEEWFFHGTERKKNHSHDLIFVRSRRRWVGAFSCASHDNHQSKSAPIFFSWEKKITRVRISITKISCWNSSFASMHLFPSSCNPELISLIDLVKVLINDSTHLHSLKILRNPLKVRNSLKLENSLKLKEFLKNFKFFFNFKGFFQF